jgi:hypothetical protein
MGYFKGNIWAGETKFDFLYYMYYTRTYLVILFNGKERPKLL